MENFQKNLNQLLAEKINFKLIVKKALRDKYKEQGVEVTDSKLDEIIETIESHPDEVLNFDIDESHVISPKGLNPKDVNFELNNDDVLKAKEEIFSKIPEMMLEVCDATASTLLGDIRKTFPEILKDRQEARERFNDRVWEHWNKPLELLEIFNELALEFGIKFNDYYGESAKNNNDQVIEVLLSLFARGCQVAAEILVLLKSGFADGAHARWRTLHEMAVVVQFIDKHGIDTAERYLDHASIEDYKGAVQHNEYAKALGNVPLTTTELNEMKADFDSAVAKYGPSFKGPYGWAAFALGKNDPKFNDVEKDVGLDKWRPYYKLASHNVHANPMGIFTKLGRSPRDESALLVGQSLLGLADPGHGSALSLVKIIVALLMRKPNADVFIYANILFKLEKEIGAEFLKVSDELETKF